MIEQENGSTVAVIIDPMQSGSDVLASERLFFNALIEADLSALGEILADDFRMIDLGGGRMTRPELSAIIGSGQLRFERVDPVDSEVRFYDSVAIVTGQTSMAGQFDGGAFTARSRYTHVFVERAGKWLLASAQGTPTAT